MKNVLLVKSRYVSGTQLLAKIKPNRLPMWNVIVEQKWTCNDKRKIPNSLRKMDFIHTHYRWERAINGTLSHDISIRTRFMIGIWRIEFSSDFYCNSPNADGRKPEHFSNNRLSKDPHGLIRSKIAAMMFAIWNMFVFFFLPWFYFKHLCKTLFSISINSWRLVIRWKESNESFAVERIIFLPIKLIGWDLIDDGRCCKQLLPINYVVLYQAKIAFQITNLNGITIVNEWKTKTSKLAIVFLLDGWVRFYL